MAEQVLTPVYPEALSWQGSITVIFQGKAKGLPWNLRS